MRRLRRLGLSLIVGFSSLGPVAMVAGPACAADDSAALVIDTGGSVLEYCVKINGTVSGIELIKAAGKQYGLSYALGYGGKGVCQLAGIGSATSDCLADDKPDFWGYWRGTSSGGWSWSSTGAATTTVSPGQVEGWAWGSGTSGSQHPQPPNTDYEDVCKADKPPKDDDKSGGGGGSGTKDDDENSTRSDDDERKADDDAKSDRDADDERSGEAGKDDSGGGGDDEDGSGTRRDEVSGSQGGTAGSEAGSADEQDAEALTLASGATPTGTGGSSIAWIGAALLFAGLVSGGWFVTHRRAPPRHAKKR